VFLRPALAHLAGGSDRSPCFSMPLGSDLDQNDQRQDYIRAVIIEKQGLQTVQPAPRQDSSMMSVLTGATALIVRPPFDPARKAGAMVRVMPIPPLT
jgi:molybdopterin molybdotransferase